MSDSFCVMPFFGAEYNSMGFITPCCLMTSIDTVSINAVKKSMLNGTRHKSCSSCWKLEDEGLKSDRMLKNETYDFYANKDIKYIIEDCKAGNYSQQIVKLYTSRLCNSTCVTCSSNYSSAWAALSKKEIILNQIEDNVLNTLDFSRIKMLSLLGGEPLYDKNVFSILNKLLINNNTDCFISLITNGSVTLTSKQVEFLSKFKNLDICVSVDGIGRVFEYLRYPLNWADLLKNIEQYKTICGQVSISYSISNLNILYYKETTDWFKNNNLNFNHNVIKFPEYFSVNSLPEYIKDKIVDGRHLLRSHTENDELLFKKFLTEIAQQDRLKNISIKNYLPELDELIKNQNL